MLNQAIDRAVFLQPLGRRLRTHFVHARHVVDGVAHEHQVIDDAIRADAELALHPGRVEFFPRHRIDQGDVRRHQLRKILVARGNDRLYVVVSRPVRQRPNDIVGLDALNPDHSPAHRANRFVDRLDLCRKIFGHRRAVRLVVRIQVFPEGFATDIKDTCRIISLVIVHQFAHHVDYAI